LKSLFWKCRFFFSDFFNYLEKNLSNFLYHKIWKRTTISRIHVAHINECWASIWMHHYPQHFVGLAY
jgi:hypothetical protein